MMSLQAAEEAEAELAKMNELGIIDLGGEGHERKV